MKMNFTMPTGLLLVFTLKLVGLDRSAGVFGFQAVAPLATTTTCHQHHHHHGRHATFDLHINNMVDPFQIVYSTDCHRPSTMLFMSERAQNSDLKASTVAGHHPHDNAIGRRRLIQSWQSTSRNILQGVTSRIRNISRNVDEITLWRCAAIMFVTSLAIFHTRIDAGLVTLWEYLTTSTALWARMFRHDHWEWAWAVMCFNVYIHGFFLADRAVLKASRQGKDHPLRKHRLQDRLVAQQHHHDLLKRKQELQASGTASGSENNNGGGLETVDLNEAPPMVTKHSDWNFGGYIGELWIYMVPLFIWDRLDPRRHRLLARFAAPTTMQICRDVTLSLLMYDLLFFCGHIFMHKLPIFNRIFGHKKHHTTPEVRSGDIVRLSVLEEVLEVGFSIVAIRTLKSHPVSRTIYNAIITFLLTELHCGFDFPWTPQNVIPFGLATGSRRHHYHHRYGRHYYQKFFCHVDRLFGFFQKDDGSVMGDSVKPLKEIAENMSWPGGDNSKRLATDPLPVERSS